MNIPTHWEKSPETDVGNALVEQGLEERIAHLLAHRGVGSLEEANAFLNPSPDSLRHTDGLAGLAAALVRIERALERSEKVMVLGDYDVDGVSSTALLAASLTAFGLHTSTLLPDRLTEGYGFQPIHAEKVAEKGVSLLITSDCGTTSYDAVERALELGIDLIVVDHHLPGKPLPETVILINPKQEGCQYPFKDFAAAGLALKLVLALEAHLERKLPLEALLRIACLGTVADVVPLVGENRIIASAGIKALDRVRSKGLRALIEVARIRPPFSAEDIGFRIGPRINAAGRLGRADPALELLLTRDGDRARELAATLDRLNRDRQGEERLVTEEAVRMFEARAPKPPIFVAWSPEWHQGVVGIAAGRLARKYRRPTVLLAQRGDRATGSGRSISGVNLFDFLDCSRTELERFGGHSNAIGMTVLVDKLPELVKRWEERADKEWNSDLFTIRHRYEIELEAEEVSLEFLESLSRLEPHGEGNHRPLIRVDGLEVKERPHFFGNSHLKVWVTGSRGGRFQLLGWSWAERAAEFTGEIDVLGYLELDRYTNRPVLRLMDVQPHGASTS